MPTSSFVLIAPFCQLLTMDGIPGGGPVKDDSLQIIGDAGILIRNGVIESIGRFENLRAADNNITVYRLDDDYVGLPGFIDVHTHICFAGSRAKDYAMRIGGKSYQEIAASGGGIWESVTKTRSASVQDLQHGVERRALHHLKEGVTTCEVKSGYGLNLETELKMLEAILAANKTIPIDLVTTCLAAHIKPKDFDGNEDSYLQFVSNEILTAVRQKKLSSRVDIFVENGAFSVSDASIFLQRAKSMGFSLTVHADQFTTGGSRLAVENGAISADHLEASTQSEIEMLAKSNVIPVALPGASIGLGAPFAPARKLLDHGASLVIASDWNPGSAPMGDLLLQAAVISVFEKLSTAETFAGITSRAASALQLKDRGVLSKGKLGDVIAFSASDYRDILYNQGKLKPSRVWKNGQLVSEGS